MRAIFGIAISIACFAIMANAAPVVLDLSRSHGVEDLKRSGLRVKEIAGGLHGQAYSFEKQDIEILLPGGRSVQQTVALGTTDTKEGYLTELFMYGNVMPQDQAVKVAQVFIKTFGLSPGPLNPWEIQNRDKVRNGEPFSVSANLNFYPRIGIGIEPSMNGLYPWVVSLSLSWNWDKQRDWNEERVWRELPPLTAGAISLDPPSGQTYERREAYKESLKEQARFEKELAAKGQAPASTMTPSASDPTTAPKPSPVVRDEPSKSTRWPWIIGAVLLLAAAGGILLKLRSK